MADEASTPNTEPVDTTENSEPAARPLTFWQKLRSPFRFKIQFVPKSQSDAARDDSAEVVSEQKKDKKTRKSKQPKQPKEKKSKPPKEKKAKPVKKEKPAKKGKKAAAADGGEPVKKKLPIVIIIIAAVLLVGAAISVFMIFRSQTSPESQLNKANKYVQEQKFEDAIEIYNTLISKDAVAVEAYLGLADAYVGMEDSSSAILKLEVGYQTTQDARLSERLAALAPDADTSDTPEPSAETPDDTVVTFQDAAFESMLRLALEIPATRDILQKDLNTVRSLKIVGGTHAVVNQSLAVKNEKDGYTINGTFYAERGGIKSLDDLKQFKNLTKLTICYNSISDISGLRYTPSMQLLGLYANDISDISAITGLTNLKWLYLYNNRISSLSALSELSGLQQLYVQYNDISDLTPVKNLSALQELFVDYNNITDIAVIENLMNLHFFSAKYNHITDIAPVAHVPSLTDVSFIGNPVADYSPANKIPNVNQSFASP